MLLLAFALSYVNIEVVAPSKLEREDRRNEVSSGSDKESGRIVKIARQGLMAIISLSLLGLGIPVSFSASSKSKILITCGLLFLSAPWDLFLYKPAKEAIQTASPLVSVAIVFMPSAEIIVEPNIGDDFGKSFAEACKEGFKLAKLTVQQASSNSLSRCFIAKPSIGNIARNIVSRSKNQRKLIKNTLRSVTYEALNRVKASIENLLRNYGYSTIEFVDISKLAKVIDGKTLKELFTYYSTVESQTIIPDIGQAIQKFVSLYKNKDLIDKLSSLVKEFTLIIPEIYSERGSTNQHIATARSNILSKPNNLHSNTSNNSFEPLGRTRKNKQVQRVIGRVKVMSSAHRVKVCVKEVRGNCAMGYNLRDCFVIERFYISEVGKGICIHALSSMLTLLSPFLKGVSAKVLGIGEQDDVGYVQCPDPEELILVEEQ
jgi:uncharacterized repeat protein (TIGR04076 family)